MVGFPDDEERIQQVKQMIREKKAYIGFLKVSSEKDENEKIKKEILREIKKKEKELEEFIENNPIEEKPRKEYSNEDVPLDVHFMNPNATPEVWNPKEIKENYFDTVDAPDDFFNGFFKLDTIFNPMSLTPGIDSSKSELLIDSIKIDSLLYMMKGEKENLKYRIIQIPNSKKILNATDTPYLYKIYEILDYDFECAAYRFGINPTGVENPREFINTSLITLNNFRVALFGYLDIRENSPSFCLVSKKAIDNYNCSPSLLGVRLSGLIHVN